MLHFKNFIFIIYVNYEIIDFLLLLSIHTEILMSSSLRKNYLIDKPYLKNDDSVTHNQEDIEADVSVSMSI